MAQKHLLIVSGEASGDLNAGNLALAIKGIDPGIKISAVGGSHLRQAGAEVFYDIKDIACFGFFDAIKKLPEFIRLKNLILSKIRAGIFDAAIMVDFSGFNLRLAKAINRRLPVIYYISPQVWASRSGRIGTIKKYISKIIVLFKFEEEFYKRHGIDAEFVGHPLLDIVSPTMGRGEFLRKLNIPESKPVISLLPGSRTQEIEHILPVMLKASRLISEKIKDAQFVIAKSPQVSPVVYNRIINRFRVNLKIAEGSTYDCLNVARFCLVASGTATLEAAIMQKPFAVIYKMGLLNYLLYRPQVKVPCIGMVNIVAGKIIIPEFIQFGAAPEKIADKVLEMLQSRVKSELMEQDLSQIKSLLGEKGASLRAAKTILNFL